jgi:hypothetical protein
VRDVNLVVLPRTLQSVSTPWGRVRVKATRHDGREELRAEYEDCRNLAETSGRPLRTVMQEVSALLRALAGDAPLEPIVAPPALPEVVSDGGMAWGEPIEGEREAEAAPVGEEASKNQPVRAGSSRRRSRHRRRRPRGPKKSDNTPPA